MNAVVQHSAKSMEWGTPDCVLQPARKVSRSGRIDYDPCSSIAFNARVGAQHLLTKNALDEWDWPHLEPSHLVLVNPPGSIRKPRGSGPRAAPVPLQFWRKLMEQRERSRFGHAIWVAFTLEQLRTCQPEGLPALGDFPLCVPRKRLRFMRPDGTPGKAPGHANAIVYVPGEIDERDRFYAAFESLGACR